MRIPTFSRCFSAAAVCAALVFTVTAVRAQDDTTQTTGENQTEPAEDMHQGGEIQGVESLRIIATMTAVTSGTGNATTASTLKGTADLRALDSHGTASGLIRLRTEGLTAGVYTVSATTKSSVPVTTGTTTTTSPSTVTLGTFEVVAPATATGKRPPVTATFGTASKPLPDGFNPFDIAALTISDANNAPVLAADFTDASTITSGNFHASVKLVPGAAVPDARGSLVISAKIRKGAPSGLFLLVARKLPVNADVTLSLNGSDVLSTKTTKQGQLKIMKSPAAPNSAAAKKVNPNDLPQNVDLFDLYSIGVRATGGTEDLLHADL